MHAALAPDSLADRQGAEPAPSAEAMVQGVAARADFVPFYRVDPMERVRLIKAGIPASAVEVVARRMAMPKERLAAALGLARATVDRKARQNKALSADETSRLMGLARLVGQVQAMVAESGDTDGFNAAEWTARWLEQPLPALGGRRPAELMDTAEGQDIAAGLLARMQSGAYA